MKGSIADDERSRDAVRIYCESVTALSRANAGIPAWWYTWLSSRDRFNSGLFDVFMSAPAGRTPLARRRRGLLRLAKEIAAAIESRIVAWLHPARPMAGAGVILVAPAMPDALRPDNSPYRDTYFGTLIEILAARGERPLLIGLPVGHRRRTVRALARRGDIPAASVAHYLRSADIIAAAWQLLTMRFETAGTRFPDGTEASRHIAAEIAGERGAMFQGLLVERALARALARHPRARVIHTYENNPWERAVDRAAHGAAPRRDVVGYLHCAVLPSHLKNFMAPEETAIRPAPDRIVCTGPAAREVFLRLGAHDPARVLAGGALRGSALSQLVPRRSPPSRIRTVLVVLEGLASMTELLRFLAAAAPAGGRRILLRPHPVMPLSVLLPAAGITLDRARGLDESRAPALDDAIAEAQAVIYQSSTAAMTALALGVPLIKVRLPGALEDDPLFACDALKRVVDRPDRLAAALDDFEGMDQLTFDAELDRARGYLERYLAPADDAALACFAGPGGWENSPR
jgi:hypothetical protein